MTTRNSANLHTGLALGGGGARGWAHLGVLKALAERNIKIDAYAGTSIGSLVGGFAAAGKLDELHRILQELDLKQILYLFAEKKLPKSGLVDGRKIVELIRRHVGYPDIESLPVMYYAVATNIESGGEVVFDRGDLVTAIRASIAIPGVFSPVRHEGQFLLDGGLVNPLPVSVLRSRGVKRIIAVNLHGEVPPPINRQPLSLPQKSSRRNVGRDEEQSAVSAWLEKQKDKIDQTAQETIRHWLAKSAGPNLLTILGNTVDIVSIRLTMTSLREFPPDLLIQPKVGNIGHMEFYRVEEGIRAGYEAAIMALDSE